jgi:hypothetical protein
MLSAIVFFWSPALSGVGSPVAIIQAVPQGENAGLDRFSPGGLSSPVAQTALPSAVAQSIWQRFASPEGRFSVLFPGAPSVLQRSVSYAPGQSTEISVFYVDRPQEATTYVVSYNDFPFGETIDAAVLKRAFDNGRDRMVGGAKLLSEQSITLGSVSGREFKFIKTDGKVTRVRMYYSNGRLYQVMVETAREKYLMKSLEGFFNSFQVVP